MYRAYISEIEMSKKVASGTALKTIVFLGSAREGRFGLRVAKFIKKQLETANHSVEIFDPLEMKFPLLERSLSMYGPERTGAPAWLVAADNKVREADSIVIVSAEYNHSIPPALSNMLDHFPLSSFGFKPSAIVCYSVGPFGGMRAAMQLRCMLGELGCISVGYICGIPVVQTALGEDGSPLNEHVLPSAKKLVDQLTWHAQAMKVHRDAVGIPQ
jgi:NAD(P)H-dependent FMN reductase